MKTLVLTLVALVSLFSLTAVSAAPTILLEKTTATGFVQPQYRMARNCTVMSNGALSIEIKKPNESGDWDSHETNIQLPSRLISRIKNLLKLAASGEIVEVPMPCDVGTRTLRGRLNKLVIEIDSAIDCNNHRINKSVAAMNLIDLSKELCQF